MYAKKDLEEKFNVSDNTVYKTLQVCGLDTKKHEYSSEEIDEYFAPARKMLDSGKKYKEVKEYFRMKHGPAQGAVEAETEEEDFNSEGFAANQATDTSDMMNYAVAQAVGDMVEDSIEQIAPLIPAVVASALGRELAPGGKIRAGFDKMRTQIKSNGSNGKGSGAAFLLQQMRMGQNQLKPAAEHRQLPQASSEDSPENSNSSSSS